jgi:Methylamine utilisation protein MauE
MTDLHIIAQISVGTVFLLSASAKLRSPRDFASGIEDYEILPARVAFVTALGVILLETWVAIAHITGSLLRLAVPFALGLLASFAIAVVVNLRRGRALPCYCFSAGGGESISRRTLFRLLLLGSAEIFILLTPTVVTRDWILVHRQLCDRTYPGTPARAVRLSDRNIFAGNAGIRRTHG